MGMLTRPKLMLPFQIARIRNYFARRAGFARMKMSILSEEHTPRVLIAAPSPQSSSSEKVRDRDRQYARARALPGNCLRPPVRVPGAEFRAARKGGSKFLRSNYSDRK